MVSKTKQSGRADFLVRMPPELKARLAKAADEEGTTIRDLVLHAIEQMLDTRDGEVAADERKAGVERRRDLKFHEIMVSLAGSDITTLSARAQIKLQEKADAAIKKWRDHTATFYHAEPRTSTERLCRGYLDIEQEIDDAQALDTFGDEGLADPDDPDDGDEPEPNDDPGGE